MPQNKPTAANTVSHSARALYLTARVTDGRPMIGRDAASGSPVTLKDIARKLNVSHGTVSKALRNDPEIGETTRERIQQAAREMGYHPNPMGAGLAEFKRSSKTVPVQAALAWINCWSDPKKLRSFTEFDCYWKGASASAEKHGYRLEEFACPADAPKNRLEKILLARGIHGILLPPQPDPPVWDDFHWEYFSAVRLGRSPSAPMVDAVTADHVANAFIAFDEIRARGYQRIGFIGLQALEERRWLFEAGFLRAQLELKEQDRLPVVLVDRSNPYRDMPKVARWLETKRPDAVLSALPEAPAMLQKCGYRVPEDIGFAAMSVLDGRADTGIYQNPEEIGRAAAGMLISLIHENARGVPAIHRELLVKGRWIDGQSMPPRRSRLPSQNRN